MQRTQADLIPLHGAESCARLFDARILVTDGRREAEALQRMFPHNPVVWVDGPTRDYGRFILRAFNKRSLVWWGSLPFAETTPWDWLRDVDAACSELQLVTPEPHECHGPADLEEGLAVTDYPMWAKNRLKPLPPLPEAAPVPLVEREAETPPAEQPGLSVVEPDGALRKPRKKPDPKPKPPPPHADRDWSQDLITKNGETRAILANAITALSKDQAWQGVLAFDEFAQQTIALHKPPCDGSPGQWSDAHDVAATDWLQRLGIYVQPTVTAQAIEYVARRTTVHPPREYLSSLEWDGAQRLGTWLHKYTGATDNRYSEIGGRAWMISAVARIFDPGCQADMALVLEGPQGLGKSTVFRILAGEWFTDELDKPGTKDASLQCAGAWIIEIAELAKMKNAEIEDVKAFLSRMTDRFRPPYGRRTLAFPRQCIFGGSVNPGGSGYLKDDTGNRRFLPVLCSSIDKAALRADRDQLWAEAVVAYQAGEPWHLLADDERLAQAEQEDRRECDVWESVIADWLLTRGKTRTRLRDVLELALDVPVSKQGRTEQMRAGKAMRQLGWASKLDRDGKSIERWWMPVTGLVTGLFADSGPKAGGSDAAKQDDYDD